jgi:hypothetical protein
MVCLGMALALALLSAACGGDDELVAGPSDLGHIHDLALADDGSLLAASHLGLYRIESTDRAILIGTGRHDLMSMTTLDDGRLLASGHPDLRSDEHRREGHPPHFGLVESTDGGQSWQDLGGLGENDFHALAPTADGLYGAEATTGTIWFLGLDGVWEQRGAMEARDLAVDPTDPTRQIATGLDGGAWTSDDGAATWRPLQDGPDLVEIDWLPTGRLLGIDDSGAIWSAASRDGGWEQVAAGPGEPETFLVADEATWWVTTHGGRITATGDAGDTWSTVYRPPTDS